MNKGVSIESIFKDSVYKKVIDDEEVELISPTNFIKSIKKIGVREFKPLEKAYLNKMLAANESEEGGALRAEDYAPNSYQIQFQHLRLYH